jgi:PAS domain S-box-containing protein
MKKIIFIFLFLFFFCNSFAQKFGMELIDSLKYSLVTSKEDTGKVRILGKISFLYFKYDTDSGIYYAENAIALADKLKWGLGLAFSYNYLGTNYAVKGNYPKALECFDISLLKYTEIGDKQGMAFISNNLGNFYRIQKNYNKAIEYLKKAEELNQQLNNKYELMKTCNNYGIVYNLLMDYAKSNYYYYKALSFANELNNRENIAHISINIAENKLKMKDYCGALELSFSAKIIGEELNIIYDIAYYNRYIGEIYLAVSEDNLRTPVACKYYSDNKRENLIKSKLFLSNSLKLMEKINDLLIISETSLLLSQVYEKLGDSKNALIYYKKYSENKDSVFSKDNSIKISELEKKREVELRDKQIRIQALEIDKKNSQIIFQIVVFLSSLLLLTIIFYLFYRSRKKRRDIVENQKKMEADKILMESEERFHSLYDNSPVGLYRTTTDGKILLANKALIKMLGFNSFEELLKSDISERGFVPLHQRKTFLDQIEKVGESEAIEVKFKRFDGKTISIREYAKAIYDIEGNILYYDGTVEDITARKNAEEDLKESHKALEATLAKLKETQRQILQQERMRSLGQLASGICHDINNSLTPIMGYLSLLKDNNELMERNGKHINMIIKSAKNIARTIGRMKEFYKVKLTDEDLVEININKIINSTIELTKHKWKNMSESSGAVIDIQLELDPDLPLTRADESELTEALTNLVLNACDAMPKGGILKFITHHESEKIIIQVFDSGEGMDENVLRQCLDPFFTTKGDLGTGLGLAMAYGVIERHKGEMKIESDPVNGTCISIIIPVRKEIVREFNNNAETSFKKPLKILAVENEESINELLKAILESRGHTVVQAFDGQVGLELYLKSLDDSEGFDVVVTDLGMPILDGATLSQMIKQTNPDIPIILLTGWGTIINKEDYPSIDYLLKKPLVKEDLFRAINELFREKS